MLKEQNQHDLFSKEYGTLFVRNKNEIKEKLIDLGFDYVKKIIDENPEILNYGIGIHGFLYYHDKLDELKEDLKYDKLSEVFDTKFQQSNKRIKQRLVDELDNLFFDIFDELNNIDYIDFENLLDINEVRDNLSREEIIHLMKKNIEKSKYRERFGKSFENLNSFLKNDFISRGFENVKKDHKFSFKVKNDEIEAKFIDFLYGDNEDLKFRDYLSLPYSKSKNNQQKLKEIGFLNFCNNAEKFYKTLSFYDFIYHYENNEELEDLSLEYEFEEYVEINKTDSEKFKEFFGRRSFNTLSNEKKNRLLEIGYDEIMKIYNEVDGIENLYKLNLYLEDKKEFENIYKNEIFYKEFGTTFSNCSNETKERLFEMGFENVKKNFNEEMDGTFSDMFHRIENGITFEEKNEYQKFFDKFGLYFSSLGEDKKEFLMNYGFEEFMKIYEEEFNLSVFIYYLMSGKGIEYGRFMKEFSLHFSHCEEDLQNRLIELGFDKVKKDFDSIPELYDLKNCFQRYIEILDLYGDLNLNNQKAKFFLEFGRKFSSLDEEDQDRLANEFGIEKVKEIMEKDNFNTYVNTSSDLQLTNFLRFNGDLNELNEYRKDIELGRSFGSYYSQLKKEQKKVLRDLDYQTIKKYYDNREEFNLNPLLCLYYKEIGEFNVDEFSKIKYDCCNKEQDFLYSHISRKRSGINQCHYCEKSTNSSYQEIELRNFIGSIYDGKIQSNVKMIKNHQGHYRREIDIYLPELNIGFEYNGIYWHYGDEDRTTSKLNYCEENGIKLFVIWEDEWTRKKEGVKTHLEYLLGEKKELNGEISIKELNSFEKRDFLKDHGIKNTDYGNLNYGLYINGEIKGLLSMRIIKKNILIINQFIQLERYNISLLQKFLEKIKEQNKFKKIILESERGKEFYIECFKECGFKKIGEKKREKFFVKNNSQDGNYGYKRYDNEKDLDLPEGSNLFNLLVEQKIFQLYDSGKIIYELEI